MPELPEVETIRRGLESHICEQRIKRIQVYQRRLRKQIPTTLSKCISNKTIKSIDRRGKYLLIILNEGSIICHLGMSGSLSIKQSEHQREKHDHVIITLSNKQLLCYNDPRRFGLIDYSATNIFLHKLLVTIGPEPLSDDFSAQYLHQITRKRKTTIKSLIMNSQLIAGIGNIYACEALFHAQIRPTRQAGTLTKKNTADLVQAIKQTLSQAIEAGGSTLRNFVNSEGKPGYFQQQHFVYARENKNCLVCKSVLASIRINNRSTCYCRYCQK